MGSFSTKRRTVSYFFGVLLFACGNDAGEAGVLSSASANVATNQVASASSVVGAGSSAANTSGNTGNSAATTAGGAQSSAPVGTASGGGGLGGVAVAMSVAPQNSSPVFSSSVPVSPSVSVALGSSAPPLAQGCVEVPEFNAFTKTPADVGKAASVEFLKHTGDQYDGDGYALVFSWFAGLQFSKNTGDTATNEKFIKDFEPYATETKKINLTAAGSDENNIDLRAFGQLPLEIYLQNQDERSKKLGLARADIQWTQSTNGITNDIRWWADDMFMITGLQVRAYRATKDIKYLDRSAKAMLETFKRLQQSSGLFWHNEYSHVHWGRANGWVASGMTELLLDLPSGETRDSVMKGFKAMMDGLLQVQIKDGADAGLWRQVLDLEKASAETSCTAMFTFALVTGVRNGWLTDAKYVAAAQKAWVGLAGQTDAKGQLNKVCVGTGQPSVPATDVAGQQKYYLDRPIMSGDDHGQCALLWAANALVRPDCPGRR